MIVDLGAGADEFIGTVNRILGKADLDGGDGDDTSRGTGNTFAPGNPVVINVENATGQWFDLGIL